MAKQNKLPSLNLTLGERFLLASIFAATRNLTIHELRRVDRLFKALDLDGPDMTVVTTRIDQNRQELIEAQAVGRKPSLAEFPELEDETTAEYPVSHENVEVLIAYYGNHGGFGVASRKTIFALDAKIRSVCDESQLRKLDEPQRKAGSNLQPL